MALPLAAVERRVETGGRSFRLAATPVRVESRFRSPIVVNAGVVWFDARAAGVPAVPFAWKMRIPPSLRGCQKERGPAPSSGAEIWRSSLCSRCNQKAMHGGALCMYRIHAYS